jgi:ankyrin repeat protein
MSIVRQKEISEEQAKVKIHFEQGYSHFGKWRLEFATSDIRDEVFNLLIKENFESIKMDDFIARENTDSIIIKRVGTGIVPSEKSRHEEVTRWVPLLPSQYMADMLCDWIPSLRDANGFPCLDLTSDMYELYVRNHTPLTCALTRNFQEEQKQRKEFNSFATLPIEVLLHLFSFLGPRDYQQVAGVNHALQALFADKREEVDFFWREKFKRHFPTYFMALTKEQLEEIKNQQDGKSWYKKFRATYEREYSTLPKPNRALFSAVKESDMLTLKKMNIDLNMLLTLRDANGEAAIDWAKKIGNPLVQNHFYHIAWEGLGRNVVALDVYRGNIFYYAILLGQDDYCFDKLIQDISDPDVLPLSTLDRTGFAPIHMAIKAGRLGLVTLLIEKYPHLEQLELKTRDGKTPLMIAAEKGQTEIAAYLCSKKADQYAALPSSETALWLAVRARHVETTAALMKASRSLKVYVESHPPLPTVPEIAPRPADAVAPDLDRPAAIPLTGDFAKLVAGGQAKMLPRPSLLPPVVLTPIDKGTPNQHLVIHTAAESGKLALLKAVTENYDATAVSLLNKANAKGETSLIIATKNNAQEIVEYCIRNAVDLDAVNADGETALTLACQDPHKENIALMLIKAGAKLDVRVGQKLKQAIHFAIQIGRIKIVKALVEKQSDLMNQADAEGYTPLMWAVIQQEVPGKINMEMVNYFLSKKTISLDSKTNLRDAAGAPLRDHGKTALSFALDYSDDSISLALIKAGASIAAAIETKLDDLVSLLMQEDADKKIIIAMIDADPVAMLNLLNRAIGTRSDKAIDFLSSFQAIRAELKNNSLLLRTAIMQASAKTVEKLLTAGVSVTTPSGNPSVLPFHFLVSCYSVLNVRWPELVEVMLKFDASLVNQPDDQGVTPLHIAVRQNDLSLVNQLLDRGVNKNDKTKSGLTALSIALEAGYTNIAKALVAKGADISLALAGLRVHPFATAIKNNNAEMVEMLLAQDSSLLEQGTRTPLQIAAKLGLFQIVRTLRAKGAKKDVTVNEPESAEHGMTACDLAMQEGHIDLATSLMTSKTSCSIQPRGEDAEYPIHRAMKLMSKNPASARKLVRTMVQINPACVHDADKYGQTALLLAVKMGDVDLVEFLAAEGSNFAVKINKPDSDDHDKTLLWLAVENGNLDIIRMLSHLRAPILAPRGAMQFMPIHYLIDKYLNTDDSALKAGIYIQICAMVENNPASLALRDAHGRTPLLMVAASANGDVQIARLLLKHGAVVNDASNYQNENRGKTALHLAAERGDNVMCKLLLSYGAKVDTKKPVNASALPETTQGDLALLDYEEKRTHQGQYKRYFNLLFTKFGMGYSRERKLEAVAALKKYSFFNQDRYSTLVERSLQFNQAREDLKKYKKEINNGELRKIRLQMGIRLRSL